jgi:hypothetical protein
MVSIVTMWQHSAYFYPALLIAISVFCYWKESTLSEDAKACTTRIRGLLIWGWIVRKLPFLLIYFESPLLLHEENFIVAELLSTGACIASVLATYRKSTVLRWISVSLMIAFLRSDTIALWREDCPGHVDKRLFKQDGNETYQKTLQLIVPLHFCNGTSRLMMAICDNLLVSRLEKPYRKHFQDMDYCATWPGFMISEICVNFILFYEYQAEITPAICTDVSRQMIVKGLNARLSEWEPCFTNPYLTHCMYQQETYKLMLQQDYNGTNPNPDMFWLIELEKNHANTRVKYAENFSRSWQE